MVMSVTKTVLVGTSNQGALTMRRTQHVSKKCGVVTGCESLLNLQSHCRLLRYLVLFVRLSSCLAKEKHLFGLHVGELNATLCQVLRAAVGCGDPGIGTSLSTCRAVKEDATSASLHAQVLLRRLRPSTFPSATLPWLASMFTLQAEAAGCCLAAPQGVVRLQAG